MKRNPCPGCGVVAVGGCWWSEAPGQGSGWVGFTNRSRFMNARLVDPGHNCPPCRSRLSTRPSIPVQSTDHLLTVFSPHTTRSPHAAVQGIGLPDLYFHAFCQVSTWC